MGIGGGGGGGGGKQTLIRWIGTVYISYVYIAYVRESVLDSFPCRRFRIPGNGFQL